MIFILVMFYLIIRKWKAGKQKMKVHVTDITDKPTASLLVNGVHDASLEDKEEQEKELESLPVQTKIPTPPEIKDNHAKICVVTADIHNSDPCVNPDVCEVTEPEVDTVGASQVEAPLIVESPTKEKRNHEDEGDSRKKLKKTGFNFGLDLTELEKNLETFGFTIPDDLKDFQEVIDTSTAGEDDAANDNGTKAVTPKKKMRNRNKKNRRKK